LPRAEFTAGARVFEPPEGGLNVRHPGRPDCTAPEAFALRPAPKEDSPRAFPRDDLPFTLALALAAPLLKKRCEAEGAFRNEAGFAARPDGLKLSRAGETGILPVIKLACRNDPAVIRS
jgi:hypothetical protein